MRCVSALLGSGLAFNAAADFPVGRVLTVSIESVDPKTSRFTFKWSHTGEVFAAQWTKSTRCSRGSRRRLGPEVIQKGARAEVLYSTPIFGEPFVARVTILETATKPPLPDFLAGNPGETNVPVEIVSGGGGRIAAGKVRTCGKRVYVTGLVQRQSAGNPPPGSHVDVVVLDGRRKVIERVTVRSLPRDIPHGKRGGFPQSHYTARLTALPPPGSTVKVIFHGLPESKCAMAMNR